MVVSPMTVVEATSSPSMVTGLSDRSSSATAAAAAPAAGNAGTTSVNGLPSQERLMRSLNDNPYFEAGFGLTLVGSCLAIARGGAKAAVTATKRHLLVTLEVTSKDRAYPWVLAWLTRQAAAHRMGIGGGEETGKRGGSSFLSAFSASGRGAGGGGTTLAQHVSVHTIVGGVDHHNASGSEGVHPSAQSSVSPSSSSPSQSFTSDGAGSVVRFDFAPCPGRHFVGYNGESHLVR